MNYKEYYENQAASGYPVFRGYPNQKGYGLGGIFKTFYKFILPLFKTHALPVLKKGAEVVGTEAVRTAANIANDAISGRNFKDATRERLNEAVNSLSTKAQESFQSGSGRKRRRSLNSRKTFISKKTRKGFRRIRDIFD